MKRRTFTTGLATGLAAPLIAVPVLGPTSALANENENERNFASRARIILSVLTIATIVTWIMMPGPRGWMGWDVRSDQRQFKETAAVWAVRLAGCNGPLSNAGCAAPSRSEH